MNIRWAFLLLLPLIAWPASRGAGEIYRYTDENGQVRFTDDYHSIPRDRRQEVRATEEIRSAAEPAEDGVPAVKPEEAGESVSEKQRRLRAEKSGLEKAREALDAAGRALMEEKKALETEKARILSGGNVRNRRAKSRTLREMDALNEKFEDLNTRIRRHNEAVKALNERFKAYEAGAAEAAAGGAAPPKE